MVALEGRSPHVVGARDVGLGIAAFAVVGVLALLDGGYFPNAWGLSIFLLGGIAIAVVALPTVRISALETLVLGSLAGLVGWTALSFLWSVDPVQSVLEVQRTLLYLAAAAGLFLVGRRESSHVVVGALGSTCAVVSAYALATRLYPDVFGAPAVGRFDAFPLSGPVAYSGALGLLAAIGALLTLGFATRGRTSATRALAGAALVPLASALYLTASRGAVVAFAAGLAAAIGLDPERRAFAAAATPALAAPVVAVVITARTTAIVNAGAPLDDGARAGHRLALVLILLAAGAAVIATRAGSSRYGPRRSLVFFAVVAFAVTYVATGWANGGRSHVEVAPASASKPGLTGRLTRTSLGGRLDLWSAAWRTVKGEPLLGTGAGSFGRSWLRLRPGRRSDRSAHNLYLETLSELGPVGLILLLVMLGTPLVAAVRVRQSPLVPSACGAVVAYVVHASVHWDWEMPVVTLAALGCGGAILIAARPEAAVKRLTTRARLGTFCAAVALAALAFVGFVGNSVREQAADAATGGSAADVRVQARDAIHWLPWSGEPWRLLGEVARDHGDIRRARESFRRGLGRDPNDWTLWLDLALATGARERADALAHAARLNPHAPALAGLNVVVDRTQAEGGK